MRRGALALLLPTAVTSSVTIAFISPAELLKRLGQPGFVLLDVRTPEEFAAGHIAGAQNIDVEADDFAQRIETLDPKGAYLVYCHSGRRSAMAAEQMASAGFTDIVDGGGMDALVAAGAPTQ